MYTLSLTINQVGLLRDVPDPRPLGGKAHGARRTAHPRVG